MYSLSRFRHSPETDVNILLLGETGVGKTTFINALVNYLSYQTLDDALRKGLKVLIPSTFVITDPNTYEETTVSIGDPDDNEILECKGASSTQACRSYVFRFANRWIRLIDGPGVGDTRGADHEARNFENILAYISQYEHLNGICILLKPALTRLNIYFRYCMKELLRHLHVSAKDNIMFVFTNGRAAFYRPGETAPLLRTLLLDLKANVGVEVPFNRSNTFTLDNEAFRFLAASKQGLVLSECDEKVYRESWEKSVVEIRRLIETILQCDLHAVQDTQSLNEAQQLMRSLARPIAEVTKLIKENTDLAEEYKKKILQSHAEEHSNRMPQKTGRFVPLDKRLTVCISPRCTRIIEVNGELLVDYRTRCHVGCSLKTVVEECIGHPIIQRCRAIRKSSVPSGYCRNCGCHWQKHMHITYHFERRMTEIILSTDDRTCQPKSIINMIDQRITALRNEEKQIQEICAQLCVYLKANAITPFNDDMVEYLRHFVSEEKQKSDSNASNMRLIRNLEESIEKHVEMVNIFSECIQATIRDQSDFPKIEKIFDLVQELYKLPINGRFIQEQIEGTKSNRARQVLNQEQFIDLALTDDSPQILPQLRASLNQKKR